MLGEASPKRLERSSLGRATANNLVAWYFYPKKMHRFTIDFVLANGISVFVDVDAIAINN